MPNELQFASATVALVATYLLHSTLLLAGAWLILAITRKPSAALHERLWKLAAIAPLFTATLQFAGADRFDATSVWTLPAISFATPPDAAPLPIQPRSRPSLADSRPLFIAPQVPAADAALVEIIPGPIDADEDMLPTIEPAPVESLAVAPLPEIEPIVEPIITHVDPPAASPSPAAAAPVPAPVMAPAPTSPPPSSPRFIRSWRVWLSLTIAALVLIGLTRIFWRAAAARWRLRATQTLHSGPLRDALDQLLLARSIRKPIRLACSTTASEPAAGGILRWLIVVPEGIESRLSAAEQHALLAHEVAHLVRRDPLWLWIGTTLCWCLPFQPLNFLAVRRWRHAAEELCDDWAVAGGVEPLTLANCLTRVAEWRLSPMPVGLTADIGKSRFARRIARLVNRDPSSDRWSTPARRRLLLAAALGCAALLTCCGPRMQAASNNGEPAAANLGEPGSVSSRITPDVAVAEPSVAGAEQWVAGAGLSAAKEAPVDETPADLDADLAALLSDLERLDSLIGDTSDDPELESARATLRSRIETLRTRATP